VALEALRTMLPVKKFFFPAEEVLSTFSPERGYEEALPDWASPIIFGLHPCELHGLRITDRFFGDGYPDRHYQERRRGARLIGLGCMPDAHCFCQSTGTEHIEDVYDLFLWDQGEGFLTLVRTPAGHELIHLRRELFQHPTREILIRHHELLERRRHAFTCAMPTSDLATVLRLERDSPAWQELGSACFACGACSMVCPTCTCFSVFERTDLSGDRGERVRRWDSCLFRDFTRVAGDHHLRPERADRVSNRYHHKELGFLENFGTCACVGCGRCIDACIAGIDITRVFARVREACRR
jgi:sulfhydrogenase subunit beta (sulfur reductase)